MLVTFSCQAHSDITIFGDVAVQLLKLMGHSGTVPGALLAKEVPAALARLETAVRTGTHLPAAEDKADGQDDEQTVSFRHRALPVIELLKSAAKQECNVMWREN